MTKEIKKVMNLDNPIPEDSLNGYLFSNENKGHKFIISCTKGGELQTLTGSVTVRFMRANNTTILLGHGGSDGRENYAQIVDGNAEVTLHPDCYNVPGRFKISVFNISGDTVSCIYVGVGTVSRTQNGVLIDSGDIVPSIDELVGYIDDCIEATRDAEAAAEHAVRYDVVQTLTDVQKEQARTNIDTVSASDVDDLKSALGQTDASVMPSVSAFLAGAENIDFTTATQTWDANANRVGNDDIFVAVNDIILDVNSGYRFIVFYFTDADVYSSNSGWKTGRYTIKAGSRYSLEMSKTDTVKPMSVEEATALYEISLPNILNKFAYAYDVAEKTDLALPYREYTDTTSSLTWASGYYQNGTSTYVSNQDYETASVDLAAGEMLRITGKSNYNCRLYCVFVNGVPSDVFPTENNNNTYSNILYVASVACTVYIGRAVNDAGTKVETATKQYRYIWDYIQPNSLAGKTWLCMGDSITYNTASTNAGNKNYFELIAERTGVVPIGAGRTGTGYTRDSGGYSKFCVRIAVITDVYDVFTIFGSTNDQNYADTDEHIGSVTDTIESDTYMGYVNAAIDAVYATGNYHLGIISPIPWDAQGGNPQYASKGRRMANALQEICQYRGIPYLDLFRSSNMRPWVTDFKNAYMPDGTHPNQAGYEIFTPRIEAFIRSL